MMLHGFPLIRHVTLTSRLHWGSGHNIVRAAVATQFAVYESDSILQTDLTVSGRWEGSMGWFFLLSIR
jgi:hypothetical protein